MAGVRQTALALLLCLTCGAASFRAGGQIPCGYDYVTWPNMNCGFGPYPGTPVALNSQGHVAGVFISCGTPVHRTFLWTGGPTTTVLPLPAGYKAMRAESMNDLGEITGNMTTTGGADHAFLRRANGQVIDLGIPPGSDPSTFSYGTGINNKSEISGYSTGGGNRAFLWRNGTFTMLDLPLTPNRALAINDSTQITGYMGSYPLSSFGYIWENGRIITFGPLPDDTSMYPRSLSSGGRVTGLSRIWPGSGSHGFTFLNGSLVDLAVLPGHSDTWPSACNDSTVVGICGYHVGRISGSTGFVWSDGQMAQLSDLVPILNLEIDTVGAISADGRIACTGRVGGTYYGLVLRPAANSEADITHDCRVNVSDLLLVINEWGKPKSVADINRDGIVNLSDLVIVLENWDTS